MRPVEGARRARTVFHLTGQLADPGLQPLDGRIPALLAERLDLASLRYDFPLVLTSTGVRSLSDVVDDTLDGLGDAVDPARPRMHAYRVEREVRLALTRRRDASLRQLLEEACTAVSSGADEALLDSVKRFRSAVKVDGAVVDCGPETPFVVLRHLWALQQAQKARRFRLEADRLALHLSDILRAEFAHSKAGREPAQLRAAVGTTFEDVFDFEAMSRLTGSSPSVSILTKERRHRIEKLLETIQKQRFFPAETSAVNGAAGYDFVFDSVGKALAAYRKRLPEATHLALALEQARLEETGAYDEDTHGPLFSSLAQSKSAAVDLTAFPDYLVTLNAEALSAEDSALLSESLANGLPFKVVLQTDRLTAPGGPAPEAAVPLGHACRAATAAAVGSGTTFVLQTSVSHLYKARDRVNKGLTTTGPSLFSVYSGGFPSGRVAPYLRAAAATESRAFPSFTFEPGGEDWSGQMSLDDNPQQDAVWPAHTLGFEEESLHRCQVSTAFTVADFLSLDPDWTDRFAVVDGRTDDPALVPLAELAASETGERPDDVPYIWVVDGHGTLFKALADVAVLRAARSSAKAWKSLQELGGVGNSWAERARQQEARAWEEKLKRADESRPAQASEPSVSTVPEAAVPTVPTVSEATEPEPAASSDEPYIETARCTSCNECIQLNGRMFAYNENKQAFIADVTAGTFRELVEAAEGCQVSIIHPGKPKNPNEPGLDDLVKRAALFN